MELLLIHAIERYFLQPWNPLSGTHQTIEIDEDLRASRSLTDAQDRQLTNRAGNRRITRILNNRCIFLRSNGARLRFIGHWVR